MKSDSTYHSNKKEDITIYKVCQFCNAPLPTDAKDGLCANCRDRALFIEVRDFIRENDVNEFQVAEHFGIPLRVVKNWINEGRIEYREDPTGKHIIANIHCKGCGGPITFGTLCTRCLKKMNKNFEGFGKQAPTNADKMRFLNEDTDW